jgi:hypothetical protein
VTRSRAAVALVGGACLVAALPWYLLVLAGVGMLAWAAFAP